MATLDPRFICTSDLDTYYVDNASGLPLSGGIVTFYSDVNRTVLKPVYQLSGTPGNYSYQPLNNPCTLSSSGTFQDALGNNIVPYYYPFTETPEADTGIQELYYVVVLNSGFVPQFVRQGWPQAAVSNISPVSDSEIDNFIPNGQFLSHNNISSVTEPPVVQYAYGVQTVDAQPIAQGGWNFVYTDGTTATFNNSFTQIPSAGGWGINSFPKFVFNFVCTAFNANALTRDLRIQWPDVNSFSSGNPPGTTPYTLFFDAASNDGNTYVFDLYKVYFFGTAGNGGAPSDPVEELISQITIGPTTTLRSQNINDILFSVNLGTIGANGDDYVALSLRGPSSNWNISISDFVLVQGNETFTSFPIQTSDQTLSRGVAGWMPVPDPDGSDLYLPLILTPQGMKFDSGQIGDIVSKTSIANFTSSISTENNELLCDGAQYQSSAYSPLGIPYSRLHNKLMDSASNIPRFGTGANWINTYSSTGAVQLIMLTNKSGVQTRTADSVGGTATGFTFPTSDLGTPGNNYKGYSNSTGLVTMVALFHNGTSANHGVSGGTSGMTLLDYVAPQITSTYYAFTAQALTATALSAGSAQPGLYFTFWNSTTGYYVWFNVAGETDPVPGGLSGIEVRLTSTMTAKDVGSIIAGVLNGYQLSVINIGAQPTGGAGSYFTFSSNSVSTAVWYQVAGSGSAPVAFSSAVKVELTGTENAAAIALATQNALNAVSFAVPDLQGVFLRGWDPDGKWDLDVAKRFSPDCYLPSSQPGSFELSQLVSHLHAPGGTGATHFQVQGGTGGGNGDAGGAVSPANTALTGGTENRPINMYVGYAIKY